MQPIIKKVKMNRFTVLESQNRLSTTPRNLRPLNSAERLCEMYERSDIFRGPGFVQPFDQAKGANRITASIDELRPRLGPVHSRYFRRYVVPKNLKNI